MTKTIPFDIKKARSERAFSFPKQGVKMPTFCWWCNKKLRLPYFATVIGKLGHEHKVHKTCVKDAVADGNKFKENV